MHWYGTWSAVHGSARIAQELLSAENTWKILEGAIAEINAHNASGLSYEELYRWGGRCIRSQESRGWDHGVGICVAHRAELSCLSLANRGFGKYLQRWPRTIEGSGYPSLPQTTALH